MNTINCKLICQSNSLHLQQLYTGFSILQKRGIIKLKQSFKKLDSSIRLQKQHLLVIINNDIKIIYDMSDGCAIDKTMLNNVDLYFKRSYLTSYVDSFGSMGEKIKSLGLNYRVFPDSADIDEITRCLAYRNYGYVLDRMHLRKRFMPTLQNLEQFPQTKSSPKVIFMTRIYDPNDSHDRPANEKEERAEINNTRIKCIESLRKEYGTKFIGGINYSEYAKRYYRKYILPDSLTKQKKYFSLLRDSSICIATTGLHGSIGWKLGEYVAFSKAIVTEKLNFEIPGDFVKDKNYLEFSSSDSCIEKVSLLFSDSRRRDQMMEENFKYYREYLSPDILVINSLDYALAP